MSQSFTFIKGANSNFYNQSNKSAYNSSSFINLNYPNEYSKLNSENYSKKLESYITKNKNVLYKLPSYNLKSNQNICILNGKLNQNISSPNLDNLKLGFDLLSHKIDKLNNYIKEEVKPKERKYSYSSYINKPQITLYDNINSNYLTTPASNYFNNISNKNYVNSSLSKSPFLNSNKYLKKNDLDLKTKYVSHKYNKSQNLRNINYDINKNRNILNNNYLISNNNENNYDKYIIGRKYKPQLYAISPYETHYFHNYQNSSININSNINLDLNKNDDNNDKKTIKKYKPPLPNSASIIKKKKSEDNIYNNLSNLLMKTLNDNLENKQTSYNVYKTDSTSKGNIETLRTNTYESEKYNSKITNSDIDYNLYNNNNKEYYRNTQENVIQPTQSDYHNFKEDLFNQKISPIDSLGNQYNYDEKNSNEYYYKPYNEINNQYNNNNLKDYNYDINNQFNNEIFDLNENNNIKNDNDQVNNEYNIRIKEGIFQPKESFPLKENNKQIESNIQSEEIELSDRENFQTFGKNNFPNVLENLNEIDDEKLLNENIQNLNEFIENQNMEKIGQKLNEIKYNNKLFQYKVNQVNRIENNKPNDDEEKLNQFQEEIIDEMSYNNNFKENMNINNNYREYLDNNNDYENINNNNENYMENINYFQTPNIYNNYNRYKENNNNFKGNLNSDNNYNIHIENNNYEENLNQNNYNRNIDNYNYEQILNSNNDYNRKYYDNINDNNNYNENMNNYKNYMNYSKYNDSNIKNRNYKNIYYDNMNDKYINNNKNNQMNPNFEFDYNINEKKIETKSIGIGMTPREEKQSIQKTNELNIINNKNIKDKNLNENPNEIKQDNINNTIPKDIIQTTINDNDKKENKKPNVDIIRDGEKEILKNKNIINTKNNIEKTIPNNLNQINNNKENENELIEEEIINNIENNNEQIYNGNNFIIEENNDNNVNKNIDNKNEEIENKIKQEEQINNLENSLKEQNSQTYINKIQDFFNESLYESEDERNKSENDIFISEDKEEEGKNENENEENEKEDEKEELKKQNEDEYDNQNENENNNQIKNQSNQNSNNKNITFSEDKNNYIKYNEDELITKLSVFDSSGKKSDFSSSKIGDYIQNVKNVNKIKSIVLNSQPIDMESISLGVKDKIESYNKDDEKEILINDKNSFNNFSNINESEKMNKEELINLQGKKIDGLIKKNKSHSKKNKKKIPHQNINKHLCYKFISNPQRFFTEDLCDKVLLSYDLEMNKKIKRINSASPSQRMIYNKKTVKKTNKNIKNKIPNKNNNNNT